MYGKGFGSGRGHGRRGGKGYGRGRGFGRGVGRRFNNEINFNEIQTPPIEINAQKKNEEDKLAMEIYEYLPKINCGACGHPTCMECARAIARGEAPYNACRVCGPQNHEKIKEVIEKR